MAFVNPLSMNSEKLVHALDFFCDRLLHSKREVMIYTFMGAGLHRLFF